MDRCDSVDHGLHSLIMQMSNKTDLRFLGAAHRIFWLKTIIKTVINLETNVLITLISIVFDYFNP